MSSSQAYFAINEEKRITPILPESHLCLESQELLEISAQRKRKWDGRYLAMAQLVSTWSKDPSTKAGAVIVRSDGSVLSVGFNGFPKQMRDDEELYNNREVKYSRVVHCEINALIHAGEKINGCTLYTFPFLPCDRCCVQMIQAGISRVVAPKASADAMTRWAKAFELTKSYLHEAGVEISEIDLGL